MTEAPALLEYTIVFALLVTGALLASGITELYFSYQENQAALVALQREKARAAAAQIEGYITEIERQMGWVSQRQRGATGAPVEQRRLEFFRLQRQVQAITEVSYIDATGREQLQVSRLRMDAIGGQADLSRDPRFVGAKAHRVYRVKHARSFLIVAVAGLALLPSSASAGDACPAPGPWRAVIVAQARAAPALHPTRAPTARRSAPLLTPARMAGHSFTQALRVISPIWEVDY